MDPAEGMVGVENSMLGATDGGWWEDLLGQSHQVLVRYGKKVFPLLSVAQWYFDRHVTGVNGYQVHSCMFWRTSYADFKRGFLKSLTVNSV